MTSIAETPCGLPSIGGGLNERRLHGQLEVAEEEAEELRAPVRRAVDNFDCWSEAEYERLKVRSPGASPGKRYWGRGVVKSLPMLR
jgi:hypothetical protein